MWVALLGALLLDWRKCFCVTIRVFWASALSSCSNDLCWEVLREQIWRRYPVNKEPAETSCEQHRAEMCDLKRGLLVPDSWWSAYHVLFLLLLNVTMKESETVSAEEAQQHEKWMLISSRFLVSELIFDSFVLKTTYWYLCAVLGPIFAEGSLTEINSFIILSDFSVSMVIWHFYAHQPQS